MHVSSIPFLFAGQIAFVAFLAHRAHRRGALEGAGLRWVWSALALLTLWFALCALLTRQGVWLTESLRPWLPGLWLPLIPMLLMALLLLTPLRAALPRILDVTPPAWLVAIHALRIAALGTFVKTIQGEFPLHFELGVGIPDLVFGMSAPLVAVAVAHQALGPKGLARWHAAGFLLIAIPAPLLLQLGLPGPLHWFREAPTSEALLVYPMALAPTVVVPCFLLLNAWAASWLWLRASR